MTFQQTTFLFFHSAFHAQWQDPACTLTTPRSLAAGTQATSTSGDVGKGSQMPWGGHGQGWPLAQGSHFQLRVLPWPHLSYRSSCLAAECLAMGAAELGPDAGQHPNLVLAHPQGGLRSAYHHGLAKWSELSVDPGGHPQAFPLSSLGDCWMGSGWRGHWSLTPQLL